MQTYHQNAKTNQHIRLEIKNSSLSNGELCEKYGLNKNTISKWKKRKELEDKSSRPKIIHYKLSPTEQALITAQRKALWSSLDQLVDDLEEQLKKRISRDIVYQVLVREGINRKPKEKREVKRFKDYEPGYLHLDVTYLPKFGGEKLYLFVAIDRATRLLFYKVYAQRNREAAVDFLKECKEFFPFEIEKLLTDNGGEFVNGDFERLCEALNIDHRTTKPYTPQTNGMVEKANDIIKSNTIEENRYSGREEMEKDLDRFLLYYHTERRHGGLVKEKKGRTPLDALRYWYELDSNKFTLSPELFILRLYFSLLQRLQT